MERDGRARYRDLARELGTSEQSVRRRMTSLGRRGMLAFRTDFTRGEGGWPAQIMFWLTVPDAALDLAGADCSASGGILPRLAEQGYLPAELGDVPRSGAVPSDGGSGA